MTTAEDALKFLAAHGRQNLDYAIDALCDLAENDEELVGHIQDLLMEVQSELDAAVEAHTDRRWRYSNGRVVRTAKEIQYGLVTSHVWHPEPGYEQPRSWHGPLPSDPGVPSPGIYTVALDPVRQAIDVNVIRAVDE